MNHSSLSGHLNCCASVLASACTAYVCASAHNGFAESFVWCILTQHLVPSALQQQQKNPTLNVLVNGQHCCTNGQQHNGKQQ